MGTQAQGVRRSMTRPANERYATAKAELKRIELRIDATVEARRRVLGGGADDRHAVAAKLEDEVRELRAEARGYMDEIQILGETVVAVPGRPVEWPNNLADAKARYAKDHARLLQLEAKFAKEPVPLWNRSAAEDTEHDGLVSWLRDLAKLISRLEQPPETVT